MGLPDGYFANKTNPLAGIVQQSRRQVWNRLKYVKDPSTGKRISRLNPESDWVITEIPELRILDDELWEAARHRQGAPKSKNTNVPVWDRRRPRFLFSGLMNCGCCGSGFSKVNKDSFGCSAARKKGPAVCTNMTVIRREDLEGAVLNALEHHLMDPEVVRSSARNMRRSAIGCRPGPMPVAPDWKGSCARSRATTRSWSMRSSPGCRLNRSRTG